MNYHYLPEPTPYNPETAIHLMFLAAICILVIAIATIIRRIVAIEMDIERINEEIDKRSNP